MSFIKGTVAAPRIPKRSFLWLKGNHEEKHVQRETHCVDTGYYLPPLSFFERKKQSRRYWNVSAPRVSDKFHSTSFCFSIGDFHVDVDICICCAALQLKSVLHAVIFSCHCMGTRNIYVNVYVYYYITVFANMTLKMTMYGSLFLWWLIRQKILWDNCPQTLAKLAGWCYQIILISVSRSCHSRPNQGHFNLLQMTKYS